MQQVKRSIAQFMRTVAHLLFTLRKPAGLHLPSIDLCTVDMLLRCGAFRAVVADTPLLTALCFVKWHLDAPTSVTRVVTACLSLHPASASDELTLADVRRTVRLEVKGGSCLRGFARIVHAYLICTLRLLSQL
jgi:hypothetical protein